MKTIFLSITSVLLTIIFILGIASPAQALIIKNEKNFQLAEGETTDGSLFISGSSIDIEGTVDGDLFCAGQNVTIRGTVTGDIICGSQTFLFSGSSNGDIRAAGQNITINGIVDKNVTAFAQQLEFGAESQVAGESHFGAQNVSIEGTIGKDVLGGAQNLRVAGTLGGDMTAGVEEITIAETATISGNLDYTSEQRSQIDESAVAGTINYHEAKESVGPAPVRSGANRNFSVARRIFSFVMYLLLALGLLALFPVRVPAALAAMQSHVGKTFGVGLLILTVTPLVIILFVITLIGIPFAIILAMFYVLALLLARLLVGVWMGRFLLERFAPERKDSALWTTVVGILAMWIIIQIPIIGGIFTFVAILCGLGGLFYILRPAQPAPSQTKNNS